MVYKELSVEVPVLTKESVEQFSMIRDARIELFIEAAIMDPAEGEILSDQLKLGRILDDARRLLKDLTGRLQGKPLFVSDELSHYGTVLAELFHKLILAPPTGKRGRPRNRGRGVDANLDYATVHKTRQGGRVIKVECKVVHGSKQSVSARLANSSSCTINTAYIERFNLDWRFWDAHLARKAPTSARSMRWLKAKFAICVACYNFIRPHKMLSRDEDRIFRPMTSAMVANVANHSWTFGELLTYPAWCQ